MNTNIRWSDISNEDEWRALSTEEQLKLVSQLERAIEKKDASILECEP